MIHNTVSFPLDPLNGSQWVGDIPVVIEDTALWLNADGINALNEMGFERFVEYLGEDTREFIIEGPAIYA